MELLSPIVGGILIGLAASILFHFKGRIAGISGIVSGLIDPNKSGDKKWRLLFIFGILFGALVTMQLMPERRSVEIDGSLITMVLAGFLVGIGTRLGGGCTSGHGVCGMARMSTRSFVASVIFVSAAMLFVAISRHLY